MSNLQAQVVAGDRSFRVEGYERIEYDLIYVDGVFAIENTELADSYRPYGRALMVVDESVHEIYQNPKKHDHGAQQTFVTGIDETGAARNPQLTWHW